MEVTQLWRYPIKSLSGERVDTAAVTRLGIDGDRQWGLLDADSGLILTARRVPELLFAEPVIDGERAAVRLPDGTVTGDDDELSAWLDRPVSLVRATAESRGNYEIAFNDDDPKSEWQRWHGPKGVFHDSTQTRLSIISEASLGSWDPRRFRPNVVVSGDGENDLVKRDIAIGEVRLRVMKRIDRCVIVTRPQPGLERDKGVLLSVGRDHGGDLGIGALVRGEGTLRVGDRVRTLPPG